MIKEPTKEEEIKKDLSDYKSILVLKNSEGGKHLIGKIFEDAESKLSEITRKYKTMSHTELVASIADFNSALLMLKIFKNARKNKDMAEEFLKEVLKEE